MNLKHMPGEYSYDKANNVNYRIQRRENFNITETWEGQKVEYKNRLIDHPLNFGGPGGGGDGNYSFNGGWANAVKTMGKWFHDNIHSYCGGGCPGKPHRGEDPTGGPLFISRGDPCGMGGRSLFRCPILGPNGKVQNDCSSFVYACLMLYRPDIFPLVGSAECHNSPTANLYSTASNSKWLPKMTAAGFKWREFIDRGGWDSSIKPFEIYSGGTSLGAIGHVEIAAEEPGRTEYGWGRVHDGLNGRWNMPGHVSKGHYLTIWTNTAG